jgi:hypothetical protein
VPIYAWEILGFFLMIRLDYLSCCLTVLSTLLVGRKQWQGLVFASVNSLVVCIIGVRTAQFGFIPANLFCIGVYAFSFRSWLKDPKPEAAKATEASPVTSE